MNDDRPTVPCNICTHPTPMLGTRLCDNCWEITSRWNWFVNRAGRERARLLAAILYSIAEGRTDG